MADAPNASLDRLKALGTVLPPNEQVSASDALTVLSALTAIASHGSELLTAAEEGVQAVADFFHQHIVDTKPEDAPDPVQGQPALTTPPPTPTVGPQAAGAGPSGADVSAQIAQLTQIVQGLAAKVNEQPQAQVGPAPSEQVPTGADVPAENATVSADTPPAE